MRSKQSELSQLLPQLCRQLRQAGPALAEIGRRIFRLQVAPALKGATRLPFRLDDHRIKNEMAAAYAFTIGKGPDLRDQLTALNIALDHPIKRSAIRDFGGTRRYHAGGMELLCRRSGATALIEARRNPPLKIFDAVASDAELYETESHGRALAVAT